MRRRGTRRSRSRGGRPRRRRWRDGCRQDERGAAIDTLEFLRRGGRIAGAQAWLGSALQIKPILTVEDEITPIERVRTSKRAFERMVDLLRECKQGGRDGWVVQHIQAPVQAQELVRRGREIFGTEPTFVSEVGPVIGTHVGPGLLGAGGVPSSFL